MSAYANLAGLFSSEDNQMWNGTFDPYQIPIHFNPDMDNYSLVVYMSGCDQYMRLQAEYFNSSDYKEWIAKYTSLMKYLEEHSGMEISSSYHLIVLYDTLMGEQIEGKR